MIFHDKELFQNIKQKWLDEFKITEEQLSSIFTFCFGLKIDEQIERILSMPVSAWQRYDFEIRKAIRRTMPKLEELKALAKQKAEWVPAWEAQDDLSGFNLTKSNGVWGNKGKK